LFLFHGHKVPGFEFIPYSPVFGVTLASTMLVVGARLLDPNFLGNSDPARSATPPGPPFLRGGVQTALFAAVVVVWSLGSVVWMVKIFHNLRDFTEHYIPVAEYESYGWLDEHAQKSDVVLSTSGSVLATERIPASLASGNRLAKYVSARFVVGHLSVTPHVQELSARAEELFSGRMTLKQAIAFLDEMGVRWILVGGPARYPSQIDPATIPGVSEAHRNGDVRIYSYRSPEKREVP
jgi:hypothetical protein